MNTRTVILDDYDEVVIKYKGETYLTLRKGLDTLPLLICGSMSQASYKADLSEPGIITELRNAFQEEGL